MSQHSFDVSVAVEVGIPGAVILQHILFWIEKNAANERHFHEGRYWTYNSAKAFHKFFPYLTPKQIYNALDKLVLGGYLQKGNFGERALDRTTWYTLTDKGIELMKNCITDGISIAKKEQPVTISMAQPDSPFIDLDWRKVVVCYEKNIGLLPTGTSGELLVSYYEDLGADVVCKAIEFTNEAQARNPWQYLRAILNKWVDMGITTVEKAEAYAKDLDRQIAEAKRYKTVGAAIPTKERPAIDGDFY